jgi:hypothetical protein
MCGESQSYLQTPHEISFYVFEITNIVIVRNSELLPQHNRTISESVEIMWAYANG